ncbi:MAG: hypothetical protein ACRD30_06470, partial [Bryobacteraceae bacterium]
VRSREMLEWRYKFAKLKRRLWIATVSKGSRLSAYAIFYRDDNSPDGLKRIRMVDFQALDQTTTLLPAMLDWILAQCRAEGIHIFECIGPGLELGAYIDWAAPHRRKLAGWMFFYRAADPVLAAALAETGVWTPSLFDACADL